MFVLNNNFEHIDFKWLLSHAIAYVRIRTNIFLPILVYLTETHCRVWNVCESVSSRIGNVRILSKCVYMKL